MSKPKFEERQSLEFFTWPELKDTFSQLVELVMVAPNGTPKQLRAELFTMASQAAGCQHCQAHGGYTLNLMGVDPDRIRDIWTFEQSDTFTDAEKAALRLARDGASVPNHVAPEHFQELRQFYSDRQIVEMLSVISLAGWYNRWNGSIATVTDQESVDWAQENLTQIGWDLGKHAGEVSEQRAYHPRSGNTDKVKY